MLQKMKQNRFLKIVKRKEGRAKGNSRCAQTIVVDFLFFFVIEEMLMKKMLQNSEGFARLKKNVYWIKLSKECGPTSQTMCPDETIWSNRVLSTFCLYTKWERISKYKLLDRWTTATVDLDWTFPAQCDMLLNKQVRNGVPKFILSKLETTQFSFCFPSCLW